MTAPQARARVFSCGCALMLLSGAAMDCGMPWFAGACMAVAASGCKGCEIEDRLCIDARCTRDIRRDRHSVIFIKRETEPLKPAALDARLTIRLPASVKAKAQRIGAAAVIAAIEAVQE